MMRKLLQVGQVVLLKYKYEHAAPYTCGVIVGYEPAPYIEFVGDHGSEAYPMEEFCFVYIAGKVRVHHYTDFEQING